MGQFRNWLNEARDKSVPTEFRIALGQLKRMYNPGEVPSEKELEKDVEIIAKKNHLDAEKFLEFAKAQFKMNEAKMTAREFIEDAEAYVKNIQHTDPKDTKLFRTKVIVRLKEKRNKATGNAKTELIKAIDELSNEGLSEAKKEFDKDATPEDKANAIMSRCKKFRADSAVGHLLDDADIIQGIIDTTKWSFKDSEKYFKDNYKSIKMNEAKELNVGDIVILDVNSIENSEYVNQFPGKKVPKSVKIISPKINVNGDFTFEVPKYRGKEAILPKKFIMESAVGTPGRTTIKDAEDHINDELIAEFKKIIKKLGGKTVAKVLLDKLGQKPEIKDEIEHIEDMIDNSNY